MKKTMLKNVLTILLLSIGVTAINGQDLPKSLTDLMKLEGQWQGESTLIMGNDTIVVLYNMSFRKAAGGYGLYSEEWFDSPALGNLRGINIIGYNDHDGKIHWFTVDNFGTTHNHIGVWKSPSHFYMEAFEKKDEAQIHEVIEMHFNGNDKFDITLVYKLDGALVYKAFGAFTRI